ncbi:unnamed protein product [Microthlaspi erraticum]|uniref:PUM-HD domain-containing protein n=1 Tax=Microthlaspi erraticum TaxID=1685480 RepID=A0A6D2IKG3_9BRAS|nr:unnamed protein product [Microthlaspi erraticum]
MSKDSGSNPMPNDKGKGPELNLLSAFKRGARLSAASLRVPLSTSSCFTQPGASSSTKFGQPWAPSQPLGVLNMMTCPIRYSEFIELLRDIDTYQKDEKERSLLQIGSMITTNNYTFLELAQDQIGSRSLRALITRNQILDALLFDSIRMNFWSLMNSNFGRHLIVTMIRAVDKPKKEILYKLTYDNTLELAKQETGCIALNEVFEEIRGPFRDLIFDLIAQNAGWLSFDPYGTHVVQNILKLHIPSATQTIAESLDGMFFELAMKRHGSYVVEKCLNSVFAREKVLAEFRVNDKEWVRMANDKFGNFVVQCALKVMKQSGMTDLLREFVGKLRPHFGEMKNGFGKNTLKVIEKDIGLRILGLPDHLPGFFP